MHYDKFPEAVLLYVFKISFPVSLIEQPLSKPVGFKNKIQEHTLGAGLWAPRGGLPPGGRLNYWGRAGLSNEKIYLYMSLLNYRSLFEFVLVWHPGEGLGHHQLAELVPSLLHLQLGGGRQLGRLRAVLEGRRCFKVVVVSRSSSSLEGRVVVVGRLSSVLVSRTIMTKVSVLTAPGRRGP